MSVLNDDSKMTFGKAHQGKKMIDVPASYLLWVYDTIKPIAPNKRNLTQKHLAEYIEDNMEVLQKQNKEEVRPYVKK